MKQGVLGCQTVFNLMEGKSEGNHLVVDRL